MMNRLVLLTLLLASAREAEVSDLMVAQQGDQLTVSFQLLHAFTPPTVERIASGLPTGFTYDLKIEKLRKWWFDRTVARTNLQVVAMYNAITKEYLVNFKRDGRLIDSRVVKTTEELERAMTIFHALPVGPLPDASGRLVVRVRVELGSKTILGFIPTTIHTDWAESDRFRAAGDRRRAIEERGETP